MSKIKSNSGVSISLVVFVVFLILKLTKVGAIASWSWWWITSPLWAPFSMALLLASLIAIIKEMKE